MSVQKVKKQFEEIEGYLGRDATGLEKLRKLKESVNVLRTSLASAQEQATRDDATRALAVSRALAAEANLENARLETHSLRQRVDNLTRDLKAATKVETTEEDSVESRSVSDSGEQTQITKVMKKVRESMKYCPAATAVDHIPRNSSRDHRWAMFDRESLADGWSHQSLWLLGASVAILSGFFGEIRIEAKTRLQNHIKEDNEHEGFARHLIRWLVHHNSEEIGIPRRDPANPKYYEAELDLENYNAALSRANKRNGE